jgi:YhcH/YjgK/YiaL family protein
MIYDNLKNANIYFTLNEKIQKALSYLQTTDFKQLEPGKYEIDGTDIYASVSDYNTKPLSSGKWEGHKKYIDIQFMVSGTEKIGFTEIKKVTELQGYDSDKDCTIYKGEGTYINIEEKHFCILFPTDIHMPGIAIHIPKPVRKVVVKVKTDYVEPVVEVVEEAASDEKPAAENSTEEA